jgi:hypothetical protein
MNSLVEVKVISAKKGKGIIAKEFIKKGTILDVAHIILVSKKDYEQMKDTVLWNYLFEWDDPKLKGENEYALAFSICQFLNHSYNPNIKYEYDYENSTITFIAIKDISKEEELIVNYNGNCNDNGPMWFEVE